MRRKRNTSGHENERGVIITLVAVFMLGVIGAMAALSIDVVTLYTARSEAQLAADSAALAGARVLANSGTTSYPGDAQRAANAEILASAVAFQVAESNQVGGSNLTAANIAVTPTAGAGNDPQVTVLVKRTDLPTFFARIWGTKQVTVAASATAEAYNPSAPNAGVSGGAIPVAPMCVKPWLLPNIDPTQASATGPTIFDKGTGTLTNPGLVGLGWPNAPVANPNLAGLHARATTGTPLPGRYYAGAVDPDDFTEPTIQPTGSAGFTPYQLAVAGCVPRPITCGANATINLDTADAPAVLNPATLQAVSLLIHYNAPGDSDSIDTAALPSPSFQFLGGNQNPVATAIGKDTLVSDSIVTIPVYDNSPPEAGAPVSPVTIIGFLQVFLNPTTGATIPIPGLNNDQIPVTIINMAGCGNTAAGTPIVGNGASPVAVRLISP
jgi:Flp pilus assembly protein TadG